MRGSFSQHGKCAGGIPFFAFNLQKMTNGGADL
jgi:hypothetical protein